MLGTRQSATESTSGAVSGGTDPLKIPIDPNGNLTGKTEGTDTWGYEWNADNQLTRVTKNSVEQGRFSYDPLGRRVEKVAGGMTTTDTYDGSNILRESRGSTTVKYVHGPGVDEPLGLDDGTALSYFHVDGLGSVAKTTNAAGVVTVTRQYDAWGNLETGAGESGYAFTGREWDSETGLYYYRTRYYDPKLARFLSEDVIGLGGGVNRYAYVDNAPATWTDPSGTLPRGREYECGPCTFRFDNDPAKGPHVHWWCPGQSEGCAKPDGSSCDGSGPAPPRIKDCVRKLKPNWFPCVNTPPPVANPPVCGPACEITLIILGTVMIIMGARGAGGMTAQPAGGLTPVPGSGGGA